MDDRGVSRVLGYTLVVTISTVLVAGLLIAGGTFVDDQRAHVVDSELDVVGQRLAGDIATADRLVRMGDGDTNVTLNSRLPSSVAGANYNVEILTDGGNASLWIETPALDRSVTVPVSNKTAIAPETARGGGIVVAYDPATDRLVMTNA